MTRAEAPSCHPLAPMRTATAFSPRATAGGVASLGEAQPRNKPPAHRRRHAQRHDRLRTRPPPPSRESGPEIVVTSGYSGDIVDKDLLLKEGMIFVSKPYKATGIIQAIRRCLDTQPVAA